MTSTSPHPISLTPKSSCQKYFKNSGADQRTSFPSRLELFITKLALATIFKVFRSLVTFSEVLPLAALVWLTAH